ncbi:hypothetical protein OG470_32450 [Micromonospora sp. NBC_00389]|uniref:hypothetical protein n=1 Tax=Micromonospora sp. NBC_00389 TaxID=2903586 RepID=UPI002E21FA50
MTESSAQPPNQQNDQPSTSPGDQPEEVAQRNLAETSDGVQRARAITGLLVVVMGDAVIAAAAIVGLVVLDSSSANGQAVAILTSAFTAIGSITTAYFGIRAATNTAQSSISARRD